ncbi:uncharacterized protein LOC144665781 [Oculina patagonica]
MYDFSGEKEKMEQYLPSFLSSRISPVWLSHATLAILRTGSLVPQEIQTHGHRAEAAFQKAMQKGSVKVYRGRIMFLGQARAGKTSLKKSLLGIPFDPNEKSTLGVEVDPSKFEVEIDQVKNWQCMEQRKLDVSDFIEDIAKIIARYLKESEDKDQETFDEMDLDQALHEFSRSHAGTLPEIEADAEDLEQSDASPTVGETETTTDSSRRNKAKVDAPGSDLPQRNMFADQDIQLTIDTTAVDVTETVNTLCSTYKV